MDAVSVGFVANLDQSAVAVSVPTHGFSDWVKVPQTLFPFSVQFVCSYLTPVGVMDCHQCSARKVCCEGSHQCGFDHAHGFPGIQWANILEITRKMH